VSSGTYCSLIVTLRPTRCHRSRCGLEFAGSLGDATTASADGFELGPGPLVGAVAVADVPYKGMSQGVRAAVVGVS